MEPKTLNETSDKRFALLIDADNVSARYIKPILNELSKYGTVTIKRIYGDWTLTLHSKWKDALLENSITPIQQFGYTQGKNATDSAMIIDAMDLLYTDNVDGFCLVSSDSDFTRLASRLRESGRTVIGMGEKKTPVPFRRACDVFTTLELLVQNKRERSGGGNEVPKDAVEQAVVDIITDNQNNGKATGLGEIGSRLQKRYPDFDVRSYGTNLLSKLLEEFTRVRITKDHSSVTVELADAVEEKAERPEKPSKASTDERIEKAGKGERAEKGGKPDKAEKAQGAEGSVEPSEDASSEATAPASKALRRGRSHRGTRRVTTKTADSLAEGAGRPVAELPAPMPASEELSAEVVAEEPARDMRPGRKARAQRQKAVAAQPVEDAASAQAAPSSADASGVPAAGASRKRSRKAATEGNSSTKGEVSATEVSTVPAPAEEAGRVAEGPASDPGVVPKKASRKRTSKKTEAPDMRESSASRPKRSRRPAAKKPISVDTPVGYIQQMVAEAGDEGIMLSTITDRVRARFKDFKVRDLGYAQMRQYMASTGTYELEKSGRNFRVRPTR